MHLKSFQSDHKCPKVPKFPKFPKSLKIIFLFFFHFLTYQHSLIHRRIPHDQYPIPMGISRALGSGNFPKYRTSPCHISAILRYQLIRSRNLSSARHRLPTSMIISTSKILMRRVPLLTWKFHKNSFSAFCDFLSYHHGLTHGCIPHAQYEVPMSIPPYWEMNFPKVPNSQNFTIPYLSHAWVSARPVWNLSSAHHRLPTSMIISTSKNPTRRVPLLTWKFFPKTFFFLFRFLNLLK